MDLFERYCAGGIVYTSSQSISSSLSLSGPIYRQVASIRDLLCDKIMRDGYSMFFEFLNALPHSADLNRRDRRAIKRVEDLISKHKEQISDSRRP